MGTEEQCQQALTSVAWIGVYAEICIKHSKLFTTSCVSKSSAVLHYLLLDALVLP